MRRYWIPTEAISGAEVRLTGEVLHHIRDVCRHSLGAKFEVLSEGGHAHFVEVVKESKHESLARIIETRVIAGLPRPHIHLALSIPRFPVFESVLEKSVELGVKSVTPFFSEHSFIRRQEDVFTKKRARFEKIVVGATQQSGRGDLMAIHEPIDIAELLRTFNRDGHSVGLFAYEGEGVLSAREALDRLKNSQAQDLWLFAGSEGGFSESEVQLFQSVGLQPATLGAQVLRVETACVALVSIIKYGFDLMR